MIEILKPDFEFNDERGRLMQLTHGNCTQVNYVESKPSSLRGGHFHKLNKETFYIINGEVEVTVKKDGKKETHLFKSGDMFAIDKNVIHYFDYKKESSLIVVYDKGVELPDGTKDIYPEEFNDA